MSISKFTDRFTAVIDACVLAGAFRRNLLLSLAEVGFYRPRWSKRILEETEAAILKITKGENDGSHPRRQIEEAFPESLVTGWEVFEKSLALPDPKDNHVLAAAIAASAAVIVTDNIADFPQPKLTPHKIKAISADEFIADIVELDPAEALSALKRMRQRFHKPQLDVPALIRKSESQGLFKVADIMNKFKTWL